MSLSWRKPAFAIPKLLQMQGLTLNGADDLFWTRMGSADGNSHRTAKEDVTALLDCIHPALMVLTLAGYEVDHVLMTIQNIAPAKVLDIDLAALGYTTPSGEVKDGHTYWYRRTGMEWQTDPNASPSATDPFVAWDTLVALSFIIRERDRLQTGHVTYSTDLGDIVTTFVPGTNDPIQRAITLTTPMPIQDEPSLYTMENLIAELQPVIGDMIFWAADAISGRWLAADNAPVGLLHSLNPDLPEGVLTSIPEGKPSRWGCPYQLSSPERKITEGCREIWQYLQTLDFGTYYGKITDTPTVDLFDLAWDYLRNQQTLPISFVPSRQRTRHFASMVRKMVHQNAGFELPEDFIQQLGQLPWAELLMQLHNLFVIDMLSGVTVDEDTVVITFSPDITGFYESTDGLVTVQLNQAGEYFWGFMQVRRPTSIPGYTGSFHNIDYYEIDGGYFTIPTDEPVSIPVSFNITNQTISTTSDGLLQLDWTMSNGQRYTLVRHAEAMALPNETIDGFPKNTDGSWPETVEVVILTQRAPLSSDDEKKLYDVADTIKSYLQAYVDSRFPPSGTQTLTWLNTLLELMRPFVVLTTPDGTVNDQFPSPLRVNDQFPLVRYRLREILQSTLLELSDTDTRSLYQGILQAVEKRGENSLDPLDKFILYITGITPEEAITLAEEPMETLTDGNYVYEFRMSSVSAGIAFIAGASVAPTIIDVRRLASKDPGASILWTEHYMGIFQAGGFGIGGKVDVTKIGKEILKSLSGGPGSWTKLYATTQWEPSDFEGLVTQGYRQASLYIIQATFYMRTTFYELEKGRALGYGHLTAMSEARTLKEIWKGSSWILSIGGGYNAYKAYANIAAIPLTGSVNEQGVFEPLLHSSSYTSELPETTTGVHFAVDGFTLNPEGEETLRRLAAQFRSYLMSPDTLLEIHGHASPSGRDPYNLELSDKRAQSVYNYLYAILGDAFAVPTHRTVVMGHGEWDAIYIGDVLNDTEVAEWRRVDVVINGALICSVFGEKGIE